MFTFYDIINADGDVMSSRMDRYKDETPELKKRTELKADLYRNDVDNLSRLDLNSNISVLKDDASNIDVDKIREMLDKRYRENTPKRKSIEIDSHIDEYEEESDLYDTKEYDINEILAKAKTTKKVDYNEERLRKLTNTNQDILQNLNLSPKKDKYEEEQELMTLIDTITKLELENREKAEKEASDLLNLNNTEEILNLENSFFTGNLAVTDKDYEDFKDLQSDIKSNSILIKVLIFIFIILFIAAIIILLNHFLSLGLF
ncbi:MAG TPA: hypothetical protein GX713_01295 [Mollicutes bacterium]|nr:hypothetical protein [Mollicutes bacterium]